MLLENESVYVRSLQCAFPMTLECDSCSRRFPCGRAPRRSQRTKGVRAPGAPKKKNGAAVQALAFARDVILLLIVRHGCSQKTNGLRQEFAMRFPDDDRVRQVQTLFCTREAIY